MQVCHSSRNDRFTRNKCSSSSIALLIGIIIRFIDTNSSVFSRTCVDKSFARTGDNTASWCLGELKQDSTYLLFSETALMDRQNN